MQDSVRTATEQGSLIIIDVQKGFINDSTRHVLNPIESAQAKYKHVIATRFYNPPDSLYRSAIRWNRFDRGSADTEFAFAVRSDALIIEKAKYSCVDATLLMKLQQWKVTEVDVCGIDTDICVMKTAVDLFEAGVLPRVLSSLCASHGGPELHVAALRILRRYIGSAQVI